MHRFRAAICKHCRWLFVALLVIGPAVAQVSPASAEEAASPGTVVGWGDNSYGQATVPGGLANVTAIAGGRYHSLALKSDGTVAAWGDNTGGQSTVPTGLANVIADRRRRPTTAWPSRATAPSPPGAGTPTARPPSPPAWPT